MDPMDAIRQTFFQECEEQLAELESGLLAMQGGALDSETVNAVFRAAHSVKGGAGAFALDDLVRLAHVFETTLEAVRSDQLNADAHVIKVMLRAAHMLADLVRAARDGRVLDKAHPSASASELASLGGAPVTQAAVAAPDQTGADGMAGFMFQPCRSPYRWSSTVGRFIPARPRAANALRPLSNAPPSLAPLDFTPNGSMLAIVSTFPANCPPTLITQHMLATFTPSFAQRLNRPCAAMVSEATEGARLAPGQICLAPGGLTHLEVARPATGPWRCRLITTGAVNGHRPSVDVLFRLVATVARARAVGVILTGMGKDGAQGLLAMREAGAWTIGQDAHSPVVYGMPKAAFEFGWGWKAGAASRGCCRHACRL